MAFKLNISQKEKAWKIEIESDILVGKILGDKIPGSEISADLTGYELEITGASDISGFPHKKDVEGPELKRILLTKGWGMHKKPRKEGKKTVSTPKGLRLRKTIRGNTISDKTVQINLKVLKEGSKKLSAVFPDQNKAPEASSPQKEAPQAQAEEKPIESQTQEPHKKQPSTEKQEDNNSKEKAKENKEEVKKEIEEEIKEEVAEEIEKSIPSSPETKTSEEKEEAAEKVAEEVSEETEAVAEKIAEEEKKGQ